MANTTKLALEAALKKELLTKSLDKITINELAEDCGISRMAFYYHFKDIYDLVEWVCVEDGTKALQGKKTTRTGKKASARFSRQCRRINLSL
jgi:AcrR family transcriptional regulator